MLTCTLPAGKTPWYKKAFFLFFMFCLTAGTLSFIGCKDEPDESAAIIGNWTSQYNDGYNINKNSFVYDDGGYGYGYSGTIKEFVEFNSTSGIIYFEYDTPTEVAGKFNAIYYKNLTAATVEMGTASNADYSNPAVATLEEAKQTFTRETVGTYVTMWGTYTK
jgi:hypothetical protein